MNWNFFRLTAVLLLLFALAFTASGSTLIVGMEDIALPGGDKDYEDLVMTLTSGNLLVVGSGAWQKMVVPNEDGTPFWDNVSYDGAQKNIGYYVTGTGGFAGGGLGIPVSQLQYRGIGTAADNSFLFFSTGSTSATVNVEISDLAASNQVYWFNANTPMMSYLLIPASAAAGYSTNFTPNGNFGLKIVNQNIAASTCCQGQQFALFQQVQSQVPEPATYAMLGAGLLALGAIRRRHQRKC